MNRGDFQELSRVRLAEAKSLLRAGFADGAYYLAGYSVECGLKACIAKATRRFDFADKRTVDDSHTHNLRQLVKVAKLEAARLELAGTDLIFRDNWDVVLLWSEQSRYGRRERTKAVYLIEAIANAKHGVSPWIRRHW